MKTIIAGTDFTPSSVNACKYAALLAEKLHCKLTIFNMLEAPILHSNMGLYGISYISARRRGQAKARKVVEQLQKLFPSLEISMFVTDNGVKDELKRFIAAHRVEAAVMGLESKNRISKFIYGSHGVDLAGKIDAPVIIVPEKYKDHKLDNVLLAVDNTEKLYKSSLVSFEKFMALSKAKLKVMHVRTPYEVFAPAITSLKLGGKKVPIELTEAKNIQDGIRKYSRKEGADLVAVVSKKHSAFYNLFVESNTKKAAFAAKVPVLAIHE